jgi:hypothetical protein
MSRVQGTDRGETMLCPRCVASMDEVVRIEPKLGEPGLIAYECPNCRYVTSVLLQAEAGRRRP